MVVGSGVGTHVVEELLGEDDPTIIEPPPVEPCPPTAPVFPLVGLLGLVLLVPLSLPPVELPPLPLLLTLAELPPPRPPP